MKDLLHMINHSENDATGLRWNPAKNIIELEDLRPNIFESPGPSTVNGNTSRARPQMVGDYRIPTVSAYWYHSHWSLLASENIILQLFFEFQAMFISLITLVWHRENDSEEGLKVDWTILSHSQPY